MFREPSRPLHRPPSLADNIRRAIQRAKLEERRQLAERVREAVARRRAS